jgi:hypothetical protein
VNLPGVSAAAVSGIVSGWQEEQAAKKAAAELAGEKIPGKLRCC